MAHLHAILAADAPSAILIKRGPRNLTGTIGWDLRRDTFTPGQWLRKKLDHTAADLSPDGEYFIYYINDQSWFRPNHVYRAVSRAPWLKALMFWGSAPREYGPGTAMFFRDEDGVTRIRAILTVPPEWDHLHGKLPIVAQATDTPRWRSVVHPDSWFFTKLQRDGWRATTPWEPCPPAEAAAEPSLHGSRGKHHRIVLEKPALSGWTLRQTYWCGGGRAFNRGISWQSFALISPTGTIEHRPTWEWADVDRSRNRVAWTEDCVLHVADATSAGLGPPRPLLDTRSMKFERLLAPY